jgi:T5SS/PEP-CTERM-associated repeat protein
MEMKRRKTGGSLVRRERIRSCAWCGFLALLLLCRSAAGQIANWNTTSGNWSNANNWDCAGNGVAAHCVPGAGFQVINIGGAITLDTNATVAMISGSSGSLTLNGQTLTATDPLGIQMTSGAFTASGSTIDSGFLLANNLQLDTSTVNGSTEAFTANITNSKLGPLTIADQLNAANSTIGSNSTLNISDLSSISNSTIGGQFNIESGASLTVANGSTINSTQTFISEGSLTIQGGSNFTATTTPVFMGLAPGGSTLDVTGAGSVLHLTNTALELGQIANSTVTVEHLGSIAASGPGGNFLIGLGVVFPTDSTMTVNTGGTASANNITVSGSAIGSTGVLSVSDSSSSVTATGQLLVASGGVVNAANQSTLSVDSLRIQSGTVTIDSGATLNVTSATPVLVGSAGAGTLNLLNGGTASASGELVLGTSATSSGTMNISGFGSKWDGSANVSVGDGGAGSLTVSNGGALVTGSDPTGLSGSIGTQSTGVGAVTLQGGDWTAHGTLQIGAAGSGTLQLLQGGTLESGGATIGASGGSTGNVSVAGVGSKWTISGNLTVGSSGSGSLSISNGGVVTNTNALIGDKLGSSGSVTVTGLGSTWQNSGILTVGGDGAASLTVNTGTVTAGGAGIGSNSAPVHVTITNNGTLGVLGDVSIGGGGSTDVTIDNGGTFNSGANATIGGSGGDTTVTVTGANSSWTLNGTGNLTIEDKGSLLVMDGGTVTSSSITVDTGGLLNGQGGNIVGNVFNNGGTVTPGDATGIMSIIGNYTQTSGLLLLEIDGLNSAQYDHLAVSGLADILGGSIDIQFGNGFVPVAGESFDLLTAALGLDLTGVSFDVIGLPSDLQFTETIGANGLDLSFASVGGSGSGSGNGSVPEPGSAGLFAMGILAMLAARCQAATRLFTPSRKTASHKTGSHDIEGGFLS